MLAFRTCAFQVTCEQYKDTKYIFMFPNIVLFVVIMYNGSYYGRQNSE